MNTRRLLLWSSPILAVGITIAAVGFHAPVPAPPGPPPAGVPPVALPLRFEPNAGQAEPAVDAIARGRGYTLALTDGDALLTVSPPAPGASGADVLSLRMKLQGARQGVAVAWLGEQQGTTNYLIGSDPAKWRTGVRGYSKVKYQGIYPGIDLEFYGNPRELEHDFIVAPGADYSAIAFGFEDADSIRLDDAGDLLVTAGGLEVRQKRPSVYQDAGFGQKHEIEARYVVDGGTVRFAIGDYDHTLPLVIDPVLLVYSTFLGGGGSEAGAAIAADPSGSAVVLGLTLSISFPLANPLQPQHAGGTVPAPVPVPPGVPPPPWYANNWDLVVSKYTPDGLALIFSTYIGGAGDEAGHAIASTASGETIVMGTTPSPDFPSAPGYNAGGSFFLLKLDSSGTVLEYVVRLPYGVAAMAPDATGNVFLAGTVQASAQGSFPIVNGAQPAFGGGDLDAFLLQFDPSGTTIRYSTFLGGAGNDLSHQLTVSQDGNVGVAAGTTSTDFPLIPPGELSGAMSAVVTWFAPDGEMLRSYLPSGPFLLTSGTAAFGPDGSLYIAGDTAADDFPTFNAMQPARAGDYDMWIVRYSTSGEVVYATYVGGPARDLVARIAADPQGRVYILGRTFIGSTDGQCPEGPALDWDLTVVKLHASGALANAVRLGGTRNDGPANLALGTTGDVYLTGITCSGNFPLVHALQPHLAALGYEPWYISGSRMDLFVTRMVMRFGVWPVQVAVAPDTAQRIVIRGEEFYGDMRVQIGGQWATDVTVHDRASMSVTVPALPAGLYDIRVVNSYGEVVTEPDAILYGACSFEVSPGPHAFLGAGGTRELQVTADTPICGWTAESTVDWVTLNPPSGVGSGSLKVIVKPNALASSRTTTVTIAGHPVTIQQGPSTRLDVNGDGFLDLIWQHQADGRLAVWTMNGATQVAGNLLSPSEVADLEWKVVGTGDLDGDGHHDLVWQHIGDGRVATWLMDGTTAREGTLVSGPQVEDLNWRIRAIGDLNGDGRPDLIWQHALSGFTAAWLMDGVRCIDAVLLTAPVVEDAGWQIVGAGDFTGPLLFSPPDGHLDIVWQHQVDGRVAIWTMEGTTMTGGRDVRWFEGWRIQAIGDLSLDTELDFIVQHETTGELRFIRYNPRVVGSTTIHAMNPSFVEDTNWRIVGPR